MNILKKLSEIIAVIKRKLRLGNYKRTKEKKKEWGHLEAEYTIKVPKEEFLFSGVNVIRWKMATVVYRFI